MVKIAHLKAALSEIFQLLPQNNENRRKRKDKKSF